MQLVRSQDKALVNLHNPHLVRLFAHFISHRNQFLYLPLSEENVDDELQYLALLVVVNSVVVEVICHYLIFFHQVPLLVEHLVVVDQVLAVRNEELHNHFRGFLKPVSRVVVHVCSVEHCLHQVPWKLPLNELACCLLELQKKVIQHQLIVVTLKVLADIILEVLPLEHLGFFRELEGHGVLHGFKEAGLKRSQDGQELG